MLNFAGKTLIQRQVETLQNAGITDISIVRGYHPEKINLPNINYYYNPLYAETNMVETLFCAEQEFTEDQDILICYADIIYEPRILNEIQKSKVQIGVTVDSDYWNYWSNRSDHPEQDMESLIIKDGKIISLGDTKCTKDQAQVRYVGLIKFSKQGIQKLKEIYHQNKSKYYDLNQPWLKSKSFKKAYMTCMLQALINANQKVEPIIIERGWLEFDTIEDYEKYNSWLQNNTIAKFWNPNL
jgi:choline kinase